MSKFNIGDKIEVKGNNRSAGFPIGFKGEVTDTWSEGVYINHGCGMYDCEVELFNNNEINNMEKFITMFLSEPEKSFRKAGVTNGDGIITEEGTKMFLTWLLKKNGGDFKTEVVDELLKEETK